MSLLFSSKNRTIFTKRPFINEHAISLSLVGIFVGSFLLGIAVNYESPSKRERRDSDVYSAYLRGIAEGKKRIIINEGLKSQMCVDWFFKDKRSLQEKVNNLCKRKTS